MMSLGFSLFKINILILGIPVVEYVFQIFENIQKIEQLNNDYNEYCI